MAKIQITRLTWNSKNWVIPSGRDNKCKGKSNYECIAGFGWEEWLFNENHIVDINGTEYQYGFIQCFNSQAHLNKTFKELHLYTRMCNGNCSSNSKGVLLYVGMIKDLEVITDQDPNYHQLIRFNSNRMRTEIPQDADYNIFDSEEEKTGHWFNVRFKINNIEFNKNYKNSPLQIDLKAFQLMYRLQNVTVDAQTLNTLNNYRK